MPSSMAAVCSLSKLKPPLALESRLLRALLNRMYTMGTGQDTTHFRALYINYSQSLDILLRGLLTETPTMDKLQHLLEHIHLSLQSKNTQERARAIQTSAALLQFATSLPGFDTSSAFSKAGEFVLQLDLCISHPASDISRQARAGIYWLHWLLLQKRGLRRDIHRRPEEHFPPGGAAGHPRPPALCQPGWPGADVFHLGGSWPADRGQGGHYSKDHGQAIYHQVLAPGPQSPAGAVLSGAALKTPLPLHNQLPPPASASLQALHPPAPQHCLLLLLIFPNPSDFDNTDSTFGMDMDFGSYF
ncbi:uncharacterized protein LOC120371902 [Mauremys reevesii]|uniref:uncharacterized protein LOC120371902 n=1 Tax=Mauremys reevesii TaxID=260615 RepID=UPI00193FF803|nr:uncharacterized protein LOC120371902 [Mauremys reevesii]